MNTSRKVLVVDDDPVVRKSFDRVLSHKGYAVISAESGEEALRKLHEEKYDIVYTDLRMPGMNGLDVAERVKSQLPWMPVVIITGYGTEAAESRAKEVGVSSFLHKPLSPEMIEDSARNALATQITVEPAVSAIVAETLQSESSAVVSVLKNIALFFAAPIIGLAYIVTLPFVGLGYLAILAARAAIKSEALKTAGRFLKTTALSIGAALIGLAYFVFFPFIGLAMLLWAGGRAVVAAVPIINRKRDGE